MNFEALLCMINLCQSSDVLQLMLPKQALQLEMENDLCLDTVSE